MRAPDFTLLTGALPWVVAQVLNQAHDDPDFELLKLCGRRGDGAGRLVR